MSKWKRWISTILASGLVITSIPMQSFAANTPFVSISLSDTDSRQAYVVQEKGDELLFSVEDLRKISGYEVKKEEDSIIFSKGLKTVRVDTKKDRVYLFEDVGLSVQRDLKTKPQMEEKQTYLPGSELLPLLNVSIFQMDDEVYAMRDVDSAWEVLEDIDTKKYEFDFERACTNIGVDSEKTKFLAYMKKNGVASILDNIPMDGGTAKYYMGDYIEYSDIFEDMFLEADSVTEFLDETAENLDFISDSLSMIGVGTPLDSVSDVLEVGAAVSEYEIGIAQAGMIAEDKLEMLKTVYDSHGMTHKYGKAMRSGASSVVSTYDTGNWGIICKGTVEIFQGLEDTLNWNPLGKFLDVLCDQYGINRKVTSQELKNLDVIVAYDALANAARAAMKDYGFRYGTDCYRYHALIYLYCSENSWRAMAEYADRIDAEQAADFYFIADSCRDVRGRLFNCALNKTNDNRGFDEKADEEETKRVKNLFKSLEKMEAKENDANVDTDIDFREGEKHVSIDNSRNGSNNYNVNYVGEYPQTEGVTMISDGTYLYISDMQALVPGIWRYPLKGTMSQYDYGELVYEISWPESATEHSMMYPDYMGPLTMGIYDKDTLCVVMPTGKSDASWEKPKDYYNEEIVEFQKIPAFDVTYAREGEVYDTCAIDTVWAQSRIVGEWFYFERSTGDAERALMRKSIINGKEETIYTYHSGHPDLNKLTYMVDDEYLVALRSPYITDKTETTLIVMDLRSRKIEHIDLSEKVYQADRLYGIYDGFIYFNGIKEDKTNPMYRMRIGVWEEECVLSNMPILTEGAQINFYDNIMYLLDRDNLYIVPLDDMGKAGTDYEKIRLHTVISINDLCLYPENGGIWIWDEKLWVFSCLQEYNSSLKVLIDCATGERYLDSINWDLVSDPIPPLTDEEIAELEKTMRETEEAEETSTAADTQEPKETVSYDEIPPLEEQWIIDDLIMSYMNQVEGPTDNISVVIDKQEFYPEWMLMDIEATVMAGSGDERVECPFLVNYQYTSGIGWNLVDMLMMGYYLVNED